MSDSPPLGHKASNCPLSQHCLCGYTNPHDALLWLPDVHKHIWVAAWLCLPQTLLSRPRAQLVGRPLIISCVVGKLEDFNQSPEQLLLSGWPFSFYMHPEWKSLSAHSQGQRQHLWLLDQNLQTDHFPGAGSTTAELWPHLAPTAQSVQGMHSGECSVQRVMPPPLRTCPIIGSSC